MEEIIVSSSPFIHSKNDVNKLFLYISLALIFPAIYGIMFFGFNAFMMMVFSVICCFAFELLYNFFAIKKVYVKDISFLVTGLLIALTLPVKSPMYAIIICTFFATVGVKFSFGGLGRNAFNPAVTARCLAGLMIPNITSTLYKVTIAGDEYVSLIQGGTNTISNLFSGRAVGGIGTTCIILILIVGVALANMKVIDVKIPVISIVAYVATMVSLTNMETALLSVCSGSFIFVSVFMMTDPVSSPNTLLGKIIYSTLFGVLSAFAWKLGYFGENCIFVVALVVNLFVPFMDKYFTVRPRSIGGFRYAHKD